MLKVTYYEKGGSKGLLEISMWKFADNTAVFRDIKEMGYRKILQKSDGLKIVEVC